MVTEEQATQLVGSVSLSTWDNGEVTITLRHVRGSFVVRNTAEGPSVTMQDSHGYQKANFHFTDEGKLSGSFDEMNPDGSGLIHLFSYPPRNKPTPAEQPSEEGSGRGQMRQVARSIQEVNPDLRLEGLRMIWEVAHPLPV